MSSREDPARRPKPKAQPGRRRRDDETTTIPAGPQEGSLLTQQQAAQQDSTTTQQQTISGQSLLRKSDGDERPSQAPQSSPRQQSSRSVPQHNLDDNTNVQRDTNVGPNPLLSARDDLSIGAPVRREAVTSRAYLSPQNEEKQKKKNKKRRRRGDFVVTWSTRSSAAPVSAPSSKADEADHGSSAAREKRHGRLADQTSIQPVSTIEKRQTRNNNKDGAPPARKITGMDYDADVEESGEETRNECEADVEESGETESSGHHNEETERGRARRHFSSRHSPTDDDDDDDDDDEFSVSPEPGTIDEIDQSQQNAERATTKNDHGDCSVNENVGSRRTRDGGVSSLLAAAAAAVDVPAETILARMAQQQQQQQQQEPQKPESDDEERFDKRYSAQLRQLTQRRPPSIEDERGKQESTVRPQNEDDQKIAPKKQTANKARSKVKSPQPPFNTIVVAKKQSQGTGAGAAAAAEASTQTPSSLSTLDPEEVLVDDDDEDDDDDEAAAAAKGGKPPATT